MNDKHNPKPSNVQDALLREGADLSCCEDMEVFSYHLRRVAHEQIELVRQGKMRVDEKLLARFREINQKLKELGKPTVSLDFMN